MRANAIGLLAIAALAAPLPAAADGVRGVLQVSPVLQRSVEADERTRYGPPGIAAPLGAAAAGVPVTRTGPALRYGHFDDYFRLAAGLGRAAPWDGVTRAGLSAPISYEGADGWSASAVPSFDYFREDGASWSDALSWGALLAVSRQFAERRRIGLGVGVYDALDETRAFPYLVVDWEFNDRWSLANPLAAGPTGPAGLELRYRFDDNWIVGAGGAYRAYRFRLDDAGLAPGGVGEERGVAAFVRIGRDFGPRYSLDIYAGALLDGELRVDDGAGHELLRTKFDPAPMMGITFTGRF